MTMANEGASSNAKRPWARKKQYWALAALLLLLLAAAIVIHLAEVARAKGIARQRETMRDAATNYPASLATGPCGVEMATLTACSKGNIKFFCQSRAFIDPFEIWKEVHDSRDFERIVRAKAGPRMDFHTLGDWFACQGFDVDLSESFAGKRDVTLLGSVSTFDGRSPMDPDLSLIRLEGGLTFNVIRREDGQLIFIAGNGK